MERPTALAQALFTAAQSRLSQVPKKEQNAPTLGVLRQIVWRGENTSSGVVVEPDICLNAGRHQH